LTTHNRQADAINRRHMEALHGESRTFEALLTGNYPEKALPCNRTLEVKVGERVMFVKNDSSGGHRYYNGMLGTVTSLTPDPSPIGEGNGEPLIEVVSDDGDTIGVGHETWESLRYSLDAKTGAITQEVEGTFSQYPLQAAWAVTIHKAQGLTFDRVVIDAADAFAFGQVYVALSRCRTLEGLTLSTPLGAGVAFNDSAVTQFVDRQPSFEQTAQAAGAYEQQYRLEKLMELFGIDDLVHLAERLAVPYAKLRNLYPANVERLQQVEQSLAELQGVSERFKAQLMRLDERQQNERAAKGADHYRRQLGAARSCYAVLLDVEIDNKENAKAVREAGKALLEAFDLKLACLDAVLREGYSVAAVQKAKAAALVKTEGGKRKTENGKRRTENGERAAAPGGSPRSTRHSPLPDLETRLRRWRGAKAKELNIPIYMVLQQKALLAIVANPPATADELRALPWVGDRTVERFGQELLDLVAGRTAS
ncbi:MAG: HRDC domain-containing protein, partial [Bacteroidales bacterium]|nr:HRDC domain-containing protein [Bacteroidales bacterium]